MWTVYFTVGFILAWTELRFIEKKEKNNIKTVTNANIFLLMSLNIPPFKKLLFNSLIDIIKKEWLIK